MLKNFALRKSIIIILSFVFLLIIYLFPKTNEEYSVTTNTYYIDALTTSIYLLDQNNYVSRVEVVTYTEDNLELIEEVINNLTVNSKSKSYIPSNFQKVIPEGTTIIDYSLEDNLLKINFSKELLNISEDMEESMLESIIYSLTEIDGVNKIMIFVDGVKLTKLPNSNKTIPEVLDRSYGINKVYEIESMKDISKVTTYYVSKMDDFYYYTPVTTISNKGNEKIEIIIEKLKSSPTYQTNLISYLNSSTELTNYEILENSVNLSFNNSILNLNDYSIIEEVKYSIALSVRDTYNIDETIFYVDGILIDVFMF